MKLWRPNNELIAGRGYVWSMYISDMLTMSLYNMIVLLVKGDGVVMLWE